MAIKEKYENSITSGGAGPAAASTDGALLSSKIFLFVFLALVVLNIFYPETVLKKSVEVAGVNVTPLVVMLPVSLLAFAWFFFYQGKNLKLRVFDLVLLLVLSYTAARAFFAAESKIELRLAAEYFIYGAVAYYGAALLFRRADYARLFIRVLTVSLLVVSAYEIFTYVIQADPLYGPLLPQKSEEFFRGGSTFAQPVHLGGFLLLATPLVFWGALREKKLWLKNMSVIAVALAALAGVLSFSKSLWILGATMVLLAVIFYRRSFMNLKLILLVSAGFLLTMSFLAIRGDLSFHLFQRQESYWMREYQWGQARDIIKENPVFGVGLFRGIVKLNQNVDYKDPNGKLYPVDNYYLSILVEQGVVGAVLYGAMFIMLMVSAVRLYLRAPPDDKFLSFMIVISLAGLLADAFIFDALIIWSLFIMFWVVAGWARALTDGQDKEPTFSFLTGRAEG